MSESVVEGSSWMVPFRLQKMAWVIPAACVLFGICLFGPERGVVAGALLMMSLLLHEVGHMAAAVWLGVPVREFGLSLMGAYTRRAYATKRRDEVLISLAGPLVNLALVIPMILLPRIGIQVATCNLLLGVVNLLPLRSSDGLRIWRTISADPGVEVAEMALPVKADPK